MEKFPLRLAVRSLNVPAVVAFGNPLLDIIALLKDDELLKKYNLKADDEIELCSKKIQELITDLPLDSEQRFSAGGSALNTMRILQWLCDETHESCVGVFCGGLGNDSKGKFLANLVRTAGVDARYADKYSTLPTGVCVSLITETSRSLVANIGAAAQYTMHDYDNTDLPLDTVKVVYIEGFFVTHSLDVAKELVRRAHQKNIIVAFNLSGVYIFKDHQPAILEMVGLAKIVFGNSREMVALAQALNVKYDDVADIPFLLNSLKRITVDVSSRSNKDWLSDDGIFVMTQGGIGPAIIVWGKGQSVQVHPIVPKAPIVDTTGAGDALVAGVLAGVLAYWEPQQCLEYGCRVASYMITRLGVTVPNTVPPELLR